MSKSRGLGPWRNLPGLVSKLREVAPKCATSAGTDWRRTVCISIGLALLLPVALTCAQQISQQELNFYTEPYVPAAGVNLQRNLDLVETEVVVRNAQGDLVGGLKQGDFKIYDNGKEQTLTEFAAESAGPSGVAPSAPAPAQAPSSPAAGAAAPRNIALFFDDRSTPEEYFSYGQQAAEKFVREALHPGDRVGVFTASNAHTLDFTGDTRKVIETIESLRAMPLAAPQPQGCPGNLQQFPMGPYVAYLIADRKDQTALNFFSCNSAGSGTLRASGPAGGPAQPSMNGLSTSPSLSAPVPGLSLGAATSSSQAATTTVAQGIVSVWENMTESMLGNLEGALGRLAQMPGQRMVVLASAGFFSASLEPAVDRVASDALRDRIAINTLDVRGLFGPWSNTGEDRTSPLAAGSRNPYLDQLLKAQQFQLVGPMKDLAVDTGGTFFENRSGRIRDLRDLAKLAAVSYRLGFVPAKLKNDGRLHHLKVEVTAPGSVAVLARSGYYAPPKAAKQAKAEASSFTGQVLESDEIAGFPAQVGAQAGRLPSGETGLAVSLHVDARSLSFKKVQGRHRDELNLIVALLSPAGQFVTGEMGAVQMNLKNDTLANLESSGINPTIVLKAGAGDYRLRVVLEDTGNAKTFATSRSVSIP